MEAVAAKRPMSFNRWLPYWAVFQADMQQTIHSWVYRIWVLVSLLSAIGFLFYRFGNRAQWRVMRDFLFRRFLSPSYSFKSKILFAIALIDHIRYIPHLLQTRDSWSGSTCGWIREQSGRETAAGARPRAGRPLLA